jgi:hypothetical protein
MESTPRYIASIFTSHCVWTSVITSKAANDYHFKTGQRKWPSGTRLFYPAASCGGKSVLVRQLPRAALEHMPVVQ